MSRLFLIATAVALFVTPVTAQQPNDRRGFWYGVGFGAGSGKLHCSICNDQSGTDLTASLRAGGALSNSWLLGVEFDGWTNSQDVGTRRSWSASAVALWYPWPAKGAYAKGGVGFTGYRASDSRDVISTTRPGGLIGIGYEWRIGRKSSINPYLHYQRTLAGDLTFEHTGNNTVTTATIADDASISSLQFGVGLVIH
ncbi:MAG: porin family protein [Gemmatimonadota bacterium]|nr:porin family protein [Gemmatimonadota bacterium]MDH4349004.1 porin family protein [Gemmatimonadota bacterium]MDH5283404.1 porin family protein [Gemmatimonadota bacterium]